MRPFYSPLLTTLLVTLTALSSSCDRGGSPASAVAPSAMPPTPVMVSPPEQRVLTEWKEASGRLDAKESVEIRPRVTGHIDRVTFQSGQLVKKGDVLFVIDPRWYQAALASAEAQLARAQVNLANATREWERNRQLEKAKAISASEADQWQAAKAAGAGLLLAHQGQLVLHQRVVDDMHARWGDIGLGRWVLGAHDVFFWGGCNVGISVFCRRRCRPARRE